METATHACVRIVAALEGIAAEEATCVRHDDFASVVEIQSRAAPLVEHLVAHGPSVVDETLRRRIATVLARREETARRITEAVAEVRGQLQELDARKRRVSQVAPVYGRATAPRSQLQARG